MILVILLLFILFYKLGDAILLSIFDFQEGIISMIEYDNILELILVI